MAAIARNTVVLILAVAIATGCMNPGTTHDRPVDLGELGMIPYQTSEGLRFHLPAHQSARPLAQVPTSLALARVQWGGSRQAWHTRHADRGTDQWHLVPADGRQAIALDQQQIALLDALPLIDDVFHTTPSFMHTHEPLGAALRRGALAGGAELLLLYTFDSCAESGDGLMPLDLLTIGLLPDVITEARTTAHAVLIDARSGYIYAHAATSEESWQLANQWTDSDARKGALRRAEGRAFDRLIDTFSPMWHDLRTTYRW